jgi:hypothetical protein
MAKNNLLLGNGQALVSPTVWTGPQGSKGDVYSISESRARLHPQMELFVETAVQIPSAATPRGEVVGRLLVHPEYLAKSYLPTSMLRLVDLRHVGTRSSMVQPKRRTRKKDPDSPMYTAELLVAGSVDNFRRFDQLLMQSDAVGVQKAMGRIERVGLMSAQDRVRNITPLSDGSVLLEAALHAGEDDQDILTAFANWAGNCDGYADMGRVISVDDLTFLPVRIPQKMVNLLASFSHVRVLRSVSALRSYEGSLRSLRGVSAIQLPASGTISQDFRAAVFDGGDGSSQH